MTGARGLTILHLSDLHLGEHHNFAGEGVASLLARLKQDAEQAGGAAPELVIVTGDLTYHARPSEFRAAEALLVGLVDHFGLSRRRVALLPGNHDVSWKKSEGYFAACEADEVAPEPPYWPKWQSYVDFFRRFYEVEDGAPPTFTQARPWTLFELPELATVVAGLNSTIAETHRAGEHHGFVGEAQLRDVERALAGYAGKGYLRIAAVHHDVMGPEDARARADAGDLRRILGPRVNLVLHGHRHQQDIGWISPTVPVLGIGSAGVKREHRPAEEPNQYAWIRVHGDHLEVRTRRWVPAQKRWVDDTSADPQGRAGWVRQPIAFEGVERFARDRGGGGGATAGDDDALDEARLDHAIASYREHLIQRCDRLPLSDVATRGHGEGVAIGLRQVFVAPLLDQGWPFGDLSRGGEAGDDDAASSARRERLPGVRTLEHLLADPRRPWLFLMGAPGAGKSSILRWICAAPEALPARGPARVPVYVELSDFQRRRQAAGEAGRSPYTFFEYVGDRLTERYEALEREDLERLARRGRLVWCFDALDEVPGERARAELIDELRGLADRYPGCRGVVTCRIAAAQALRGHLVPPSPTDAADGADADEADADEAGADEASDACVPEAHAVVGGLVAFTPAVIRPFDRPRIDAFLGRWHAVVDADDPERQAHRRQRIAEAMDRSPALVELAGTPLLLTLLALLGRGQELPIHRHELYREFLTLMAERWDANKHQRVPDRFRFADRRRLLRELAWAMVEASGDATPQNTIPEAALRSFTVGFCARVFGEAAEDALITADNLLREVRERDFVLASRGDGSFCFVHKAIFEYSVASEICQRLWSHRWTIEAVAELAGRRWRDESWGEILRMVGAMLGESEPRHAVEVLQGVWRTVNPCAPADVWGGLDWSMRYLAGIENLESTAMRGLLARLGAILTLVLRTKSHFDWPSWARVGPRLPNSEHLRGQLEGVIPERDGPVPLMMAALAGLEGREDFLRHALTSIYTDRFELAIAWAATLGPWSEAERRILADMVDLTRVSHGFLSMLAAMGIGAAQERLHRDIEALNARALFALGWDIRTPTHLFELVYARVERAASEDPLSFLTLDPVILAHAPDDARLRFILDRAEAALLAEEPPYQLTSELWVDFLVRSMRRPALFARWAARLTRQGPDYWWLHNLFDLCRAGWAPALSLRDVLVEDCLEYDFSGGDSNTIAVFLHNTPTPLPVEALLKKVSRVRLNVPALVDALLAREPSPDQAKFDAILALVGTLCPLDERTLDSIYTLSTLSQRWLHPTVVANALRRRDFPRLARLIPDPLADPRVAALLDELRTGDPPEHARALLELGRPDLVPRAELEELAASDESEPFNVAFRIAAQLGDLPTLRQLAGRPLPDLADFAPETPAWSAVRQRHQHAARITFLLDLADRIDALVREGRLRRAEVRLRGRPVGRLEELPGGETRFAYLPGYLAAPDATPISPTLPLQPAPYTRVGLHPFFDNLLPEGWLKAHVLARHRLAEGDKFGLLLATGADTIGAVEVIPLAEEPRAA